MLDDVFSIWNFEPKWSWTGTSRATWWTIFKRILLNFNQITKRPIITNMISFWKQSNMCSFTILIIPCSSNFSFYDFPWVPVEAKYLVNYGTRSLAQLASVERLLAVTELRPEEARDLQIFQDRERTSEITPPPETNIAPENRPSQKETHLPIFRCYGSFREIKVYRFVDKSRHNMFFLRWKVWTSQWNWFIFWTTWWFELCQMKSCKQVKYDLGHTYMHIVHIYHLGSMNIICILQYCIYSPSIWSIVHLGVFGQWTNAAAGK